MDSKTLEKIRKQEGTHRNDLSRLPDNYYEDCREALSYAFKTQDYEEFKTMQIIIKHINERRMGKLLNYAIYRSTPRRMINSEPISNILPEEQKLLDSFLASIAQFNDELDLKMDGYLLQEVLNG